MVWTENINRKKFFIYIFLAVEKQKLKLQNKLRIMYELGKIQDQGEDRETHEEIYREFSWPSCNIDNTADPPSAP